MGEVIRVDFEGVSFNTPNCPDCLGRMDDAEIDGEPVWVCTICGRIEPFPPEPLP